MAFLPFFPRGLPRLLKGEMLLRTRVTEGHPVCPPPFFLSILLRFCLFVFFVCFLVIFCAKFKSGRRFFGRVTSRRGCLREFPVNLIVSMFTIWQVHITREPQSASVAISSCSSASVPPRVCHLICWLAALPRPSVSAHVLYENHVTVQEFGRPDYVHR